MTFRLLSNFKVVTGRHYIIHSFFSNFSLKNILFVEQNRRKTKRFYINWIKRFALKGITFLKSSQELPVQIKLFEIAAH